MALLTRGLLRFRLSFCALSSDTICTRLSQGISVRALASPAASQASEQAAADGNDEQSERRAQWTPESRRTGAIAVKLGMTQMWNDRGDPVPVTVLQVLDNEVVNVRTKAKEGYWGLQVGGINHPKPKNLLKPVLGQYQRAGVVPKRKLWEFRVTEDALLSVGTAILASHFVCGQYVDVCAKSIGKGFQGVMKRHGMKGQPASHGHTKTHRKMGATGGGQDPGRIWPGKRMPGRMGGKRVTTPSLQVVRINQRFNVVYVRGAVPGHRNTFVRVTDARRRPHVTPPPFPTYYPELDGREGGEEEEEEEGEEGRDEREQFSSVSLPGSSSIEYPNRYDTR